MKKTFVNLADVANKAVASRAFLILAIAWFVVQAVYMALSTKYGVSPDETYHFTLIQFYSQHALPFSSNQEGFYWLGDITRNVGYMYHYLLSWPYRWLPPANALMVLRILNVGLSTLTLVVFAKATRSLKLPTVLGNLSVFMLANTVMFVFLSSAINYDNLVNLLAITLFWLFIELFNKFTPGRLLALAITATFGLIVKVTILPLVILMVFALLVSRWRELAKLLANLPKAFMRTKTLKFGLVILFLLVALVGERYVYNVVKYHALVPSCELVHTVEQCQHSAIFRRKQTLTASPAAPASGFTQFSMRWGMSMKAKVFGVMGHKSFRDIGVVKLGTGIYVVLLVVALIRKFKLDKSTQSVVMLIALGYTLILLLQNYDTYQRTGLYGLALQGRYVFPVLPIIYAAGNGYIWSMFNKTAQLLFTIFILVIFGLGGLPQYIVATDSTWYPTEAWKYRNLRLRNFFKDFYLLNKLR